MIILPTMLNKILIGICCLLGFYAIYLTISVNNLHGQVIEYRTQAGYEDRIQTLERFAQAVTNIINGTNTQSMPQTPAQGGGENAGNP